MKIDPSAGEASTAFPKIVNASHDNAFGASIRSCREHVPKSNSRAETSARCSAPSIVRYSAPSATKSGGFVICSACASLRAGRSRVAASGANSALARSRSIS